jgi:hypothetical protein
MTIQFEENTGRAMHQTAPYPQELAKLAGALRYRRDRGWKVWLEDDRIRDHAGRHSGESRGLTLIVQRHGPNTYDRGEPMTVNHYFPVPPATFNQASWLRWLFDRLGDVDTHERMEDFAFATALTGSPEATAGRDGLHRPYAPNHGPGWDPYLITVLGTETDRRTAFTGEVSGH